MTELKNVVFHYFVRRQTFPGWEILPRFIQDYELVLVIRGKGYIRVEGETFPVKAGDLICFRPGMRHSLWAEEEPCFEFYGMHFALPEDAPPLPFPTLFHLEAQLRLELLFKRMQEIWVEKGPLYQWRRDLGMQQILCEICILLEEQKEPMSRVRVQKALAYINENPCRKITLEDLLQYTGIQKTAFLQAFRLVTGTTPLQYIIERRLEIARDLLAYSDISVEEAARNSGFSDPFYFSRCFRRHFALSPRDYRNACQANRQG